MARARTVFVNFIALPIVLLALLLTILPSILNTQWFADFLSEELSELTGRSVRFDSPITLQLGSSLNLQIEDFSIASPSWSEEKKMLSIAHLSVTAPLWRNLRDPYQIEDLWIVGLTTRVEESEEGASNWSFEGDRKGEERDEKEDADSSSETSFPTVEILRIAHADLQIMGDEEPRDFYFRELEIQDLFDAEKNDLFSALKVDGVPVTLKGGTSSIGRFVDGGKLRFDAELRRDSLTLSADGEIREDGNISVSIQSEGEDFSALSPLFRAPLPAWKDYSLEGDLLYEGGDSAKVQVSDLSLSVDDNSLQGSAILTFDPLLIEADLKGKNVNLKKLVPPSNEEEEAVEEESEDGEAQIPYQSLQGFNLRLDLEAEELTPFTEIAFTDLSLKASLEDGAISVPKLTTRVFGGDLDASLQASPDLFVFKGTGTNFDANPLVLAAGGDPVLSGRFNLALDLKSSGEKVEQLLGGLNGSVALTSEKAELTSSALKTASSGLFSILSPIFGDTDHAAVKCLIFRYDLQNGVARSKEQVLKLGEVFIFGEGKLNLPENSLTYNFHVNSRNPALASLIPPFRSFGSIADPSFAPSISGSVASAADTTQGVANTAMNLFADAAKFIARVETEELSGTELCQKAYDAEQSLLSSRIGRVLEGREPRTKGDREPGPTADQAPN